MPEDSIMDWVDNEEDLYKAKFVIFDRWMREGDTWSEARAHRKAHSFARNVATYLRERGLARGYKLADFGQAADEMLEEFREHQEEVIKAKAEEMLRAPVPEEPMTPGEVEHAQKYEVMARRIGIDELRTLIPVSPERVRKALERGDKHLNTIPLWKWDAAAAEIDLVNSIGEGVSLLKHVARWHYA